MHTSQQPLTASPTLTHYLASPCVIPKKKSWTMLPVKDLLCSEEDTRLEDLVAGKGTLVRGSKIDNFIQSDSRLSALAAQRPGTHPDVELSAPLSSKPRIECPFLSSSSSFPLATTLNLGSVPAPACATTTPKQTSPLRLLSSMDHEVTSPKEEPKSQPNQSPVETQLCKVAVFVQEISGRDPVVIEVDKTNETLLSFSEKIEKQLGIPVQSQTIKVLQSPDVAVYAMKTMPTHKALATKIPTCCAFFLQLDTEVGNAAATTQGISSPSSISNDGSADDQDMSFTLPLRVGRYLKMHLDKPSCAADPSQNDVRRRLTTLLNNRSMQISLDVLASMTNFSKSSLSLWRRGSYRGNNSMVAKAVAEALAKLEECNYNYEPSVHDASCTVAKGRPFVKPTDKSHDSNDVALTKKRRKLSE